MVSLWRRKAVQFGLLIFPVWSVTYQNFTVHQAPDILEEALRLEMPFTDFEDIWPIYIQQKSNTSNVMARCIYTKTL